MTWLFYYSFNKENKKKKKSLSAKTWIVEVELKSWAETLLFSVGITLTYNQVSFETK